MGGIILPAVVLVSAALSAYFVRAVVSGQQSTDLSEHEELQSPAHGSAPLVPRPRGVVERVGEVWEQSAVPIDDIIVRRAWQERTILVRAGCKAVLFQNEKPLAVLPAGRQFFLAKGMPFAGERYVIEFDLRQTHHWETLSDLRLADGSHIDVDVHALVQLRAPEDDDGFVDWVLRYNLLSVPKSVLLREEFHRRIQYAFGRLDRSQVESHAYLLPELQHLVGPTSPRFLSIAEIIGVSVRENAELRAQRQKLEIDAMRLRALTDLARETGQPLYLVDDEFGQRFRSTVETITKLYSVTSGAFSEAFGKLVASTSGIADLAVEQPEVVPWLIRSVDGLVPKNILETLLGSLGPGIQREEPLDAGARDADAAGWDRPDPVLPPAPGTPWSLPHELRMTPDEARIMVRDRTLSDVVGSAIAASPRGDRVLYLVTDDLEFLEERIGPIRSSILLELEVTDVVVLERYADAEQSLPEWSRWTSRVRADRVDGRREADGTVMLAFYDGSHRLINDDHSLVRLRTLAEVVGALSGEPAVRIDAGRAP